jgi:Protein of unknown function (DUF3224)
MPTRATCTFEVKSWDEHAFNDVDGRLKLTRASVAFAYHGDLEGESVIEYLMLYRDDGSAATVALERVTGILGGKTGSFVLEHHGGYADGTATGEFTVVSGSSTGDLEGLRGQGTSVARHDGSATVSLDYDFGPAGQEVVSTSKSGSPSA